MKEDGVSQCYLFLSIYLKCSVAEVFVVCIYQILSIVVVVQSIAFSQILRLTSYALLVVMFSNVVFADYVNDVGKSGSSRGIITNLG